MFATEVEVSIRPMTEDDISSVLEIDSEIIGERRVPTYANPVESYVGGTLSASLVAEASGQVVGFVLCRRAEPSGVPAISNACIELIGVRLSAQRRGVGTALIAKLLENCRMEKIQRLSFIADRRDTVLQQFFTSLGFQQGHHINYVVNLEQW